MPFIIFFGMVRDEQKYWVNIFPYIPDLYSVLFLQSTISISAVPAITNSNSLASNIETARESTT